MITRFSKLIATTGMAATLAVGALPKPAAADTQSTIDTVLGAAALIGGLVLYNNYEHERQAANAIVGYTRNGGTVYGDGRIVMPNGQTIYPNGNGQYPWGQRAYYSLNATGYVYDTRHTGQYDRTHRHGASVYRPVAPMTQRQAYAPPNTGARRYPQHSAYHMTTGSTYANHTSSGYHYGTVNHTSSGYHYGTVNHTSPSNHYGTVNHTNRGSYNGATNHMNTAHNAPQAHPNSANRDDRGNHGNQH